MAKAPTDRNPEILGGTPVFSSTRVPVRILIEHLEAGGGLMTFVRTTLPYLGNKPLRSFNTPKLCFWTARVKLLLDESVPRGLSATFPDLFKVHSVPQMGWSGNGRLLRLTADRGFAAPVAVDRGMAHGQNPNDLQIPVIIMLAVRNRLQELRPLVPQVIDMLSGRLLS
ncbi:MAG: DUF433 domain-containing protein [Rhodobacteraceae bacterium]|nr:DUF433 domain-containing protein [Paracoccaceae bacterium]